MAEVNTAEREAKADAAFGAGFGGTPPAPAAKVVEEPKPEPAKPAAPVAPAKPPEKPEYVRLTKQEWDNTKAAAGKVPSLESQVAKLTGAIPKAEQIVQQVVEKVQSHTPAGLAVEFSDEDFAELTENFPEVAKMTRASLERLFKKANVRSTAAPGDAKPLDEGAVAKAVETVLIGREKQALEETHPTWRDIVGAVDMSAGEKPPEGNPFRQWLAEQPAAYQKKINDTESPAVVQGAIERFLAQDKAPKQQAPAGTPTKPDKAAARRAVIEDAVTPRADGNPPPPNRPLSAEEAFGLGFKTGRPH